MKENELEVAMKFLKNYKRFFQLDDDDVQEILIKFIVGYKNEAGAVSTFLGVLIRNYNITKWRKDASAKHSHTAIQIENVTEGDDREWLMGQIASNDPQIEVYTDEEQFKDMIKLGLECLTKKQREVIELYFFEELTNQEIGDRLGITHQNASLHRFRAIEKMKLFFEKNNISWSF